MMEANVDRREDWQKGATVQFSVVRGEPAVRLVCTCKRTLSEDFDNGQLICLRCGNTITIKDASDMVSQFVEKAEKVLESLAKALQTLSGENIDEKPAKNQAKSRTSKASDQSDQMGAAPLKDG
jgi:hypothetical protein